MKRLLNYYFVFTILMCMFWKNGFAYYDISVVNDDGVEIYYQWHNWSDEKVLFVANKSSWSPENSYSGNVVIPQTVEYQGQLYPVMGISEKAFYKCINLTSVTIPNGIWDIEDEAFSGCSLTSLIIPNSVTKIGEEAFYHCNDLKSITITPSGIRYIGDYSFLDCDNLVANVIVTDFKEFLTNSYIRFLQKLNVPAKLFDENYNEMKEITIPDGVYWISDYAFYKCIGLTSVTIPEDISGIGRYAFYGCSSLEYIKIEATKNLGYDRDMETFSECPNLKEIYFDCEIVPLIFKGITSIEKVTMSNKVTKICKEAFSGCSNLASITISNGVTSISDKTFSGCKSLKSIDIPNSVTSIGNDAFYGCTGFTSITFPNSLTTIGDYAFYGCTGFTSITFPNSLTTIGQGAFRNCTGLTSLTIPNNVTRIGDSAFDGINFTSLTIYGEAPNLGFYGCKVDTVIFHCKEILPSSVYGKNVIIGDEVTRIHDGAFSSRKVITSVSLGSGLTTIGTGAFNSCPNLTSIVIPDNVVTIGNEAFDRCRKLKSVRLGNSLTLIGSRAFRDCRMTSITIPASVRIIRLSAFENVPFRAVVSLIENPFPIDDDESGYSVFTYHNTLYVPAGTIEKYKMRKGWKDFYKIEEIPNETNINTVTKDSDNRIIHSLRGEKLKNPSKGINIIKLNDGTVKKVLVK